MTEKEEVRDGDRESEGVLERESQGTKTNTETEREKERQRQRACETETRECVVCARPSCVTIGRSPIDLAYDG